MFVAWATFWYSHYVNKCPLFQLAQFFMISDAVAQADRATPFRLSIGWTPKPHATKQIQDVACLSSAALPIIYSPSKRLNLTTLLCCLYRPVWGCIDQSVLGSLARDTVDIQDGRGAWSLRSEARTALLAQCHEASSRTNYLYKPYEIRVCRRSTRVAFRDHRRYHTSRSRNAIPLLDRIGPETALHQAYPSRFLCIFQLGGDNQGQVIV